MTTKAETNQNDNFLLGWIILLFISGLASLNHLMLPVYGDPLALGVIAVGYSLFAIIVLAIPFRRGECWAWYTSWIQVVGFASLIFSGIPAPEMQPVVAAYTIGAIVMALCLVLTAPVFFRRDAQARKPA